MIIHSFIHSANVCPSLHLLQLWVSGPSRFFWGGSGIWNQGQPCLQGPLCVSLQISEKEVEKEYPG